MEPLMPKKTVTVEGSAQILLTPEEVQEWMDSEEGQRSQQELEDLRPGLRRFLEERKKI